jgi:beta-phosphoglucomutase-like phosphatase (HAD superfamily)
MNYSPPTPAFLFDLDGTLVDSVYQHVLAWREALESCGIQPPVWRIHRRMGTSGELFTAALLRETGRAVTQDQIEQLQRHHEQAYARQLSTL